MLPRPFIAVLAITLGLPFLLFLTLVASTSGISASAFTATLTLAVISIFLILMVFEIKRVADLPPEDH